MRTEASAFRTLLNLQVSLVYRGHGKSEAKSLGSREETAYTRATGEQGGNPP